MNDSRPRLKRLLSIAGILLLLGYGLFEARRYLTGPILAIDRPTPGEVIDGPTVRVSGHAENLSYLYINGTQAFVDEHGTISWVYTPPRGYTVLTARASDRFGRERTVSIPFIVK